MEQAGPDSVVDKTIEKYARWVIRHKAWTIFLTLALALGLGSGMRHLTFVGDYRAYFSDDNPQLVALEALENTYTKNDNILFVVSPASGKVFSNETLEALAYLTEQAWQLPYSLRVDSVTNFQHTYAEADDLVVEDLITDYPSTAETLAEKQQIALSEPRLLNRIISQDARTTAVLVTFQMPEDDAAALEEIIPRVRQLVSEVDKRFPLVEIRLSGEMMITTAFSEVGNRDAVTLTPLMYVAIIMMIVLLLRSIVAAAAVILVVTLSVVSALGIAGWSGLYLTVSSIAAPTMIMTLALADTIHVLVSMFAYVRDGQNRTDALANSIRINFSPVLITSLTTAVGFLTLNFIDVPPFRDFGNISALGIVAALLYSMTLLPAFIACFKLKGGGRAVITSAGLMDKLGDYVINHRRKLLILMLVSSAFLLMASFKNEANNQIIQFFGPDIQFRQDSDYTIDNLTGLYTIEYSIPAAKSNGIAEPDYLTRLDDFSDWLRSQPDVLHVSTLTDTIKRLNKNLHEDDENWYRLPESRELASQYLLLYELSLPYGLDLNNEVSIDKSATRVIVTLADVSSADIKALRDSSENWLRANAPAMFTYGTGASVMFADIFALATKTMIKGALLGMLVISAILIFALKSFKHGVLSLLPNLLPAGLAFGLWALWVGQVNMAVSLVMTMTLGIVVDDTVHFMSKYLRARREMGCNSADAVRYAFNSVGLALVVTSVALVVGFLIMSQSSFALNAQSSQITLIAILLALVVDFLLLPPLLMLLDREKSALDVSVKARIND